MGRYEGSAASPLAAVLAFVIFAQKVCSAGGMTTAGHMAYAQAHADRQSPPPSPPSPTDDGSATSTSYFRHDPFGPNTYAFGYEINDTLRSGNVQFREERGYVGGRVEGAYGYARPDGRVTVTRFTADKRRGYRSDTETYAVGGWQRYWPSRRHGPFAAWPQDARPTAAATTANVTHDRRLHLNATDRAPPAATVAAVHAQHAIDVAPSVVELPPALLDPVVSDIINGKIPLQGQGGGGDKLGFETLHNFIPPEFPIVPFDLPQKLQDELEAEKKEQPGTEQGAKAASAAKSKPKPKLEPEPQPERSGKKAADPTMTPTRQRHKGDMAKGHNAEKSLPAAVVRRAVVADDERHARAEPLASAQPAAKAPWYGQLLNKTGELFHKNVPNLRLTS